MDAPHSIVMAILWLLGGLALFLYGIELMSDALRRAAGKSLRVAFRRITRTRFHGLLTGALVTGLLQSSSATTVMVVGFINAGLLAFPQSIGLILGANIGTTVTPQITALAGAFKLESLALPLLGIGFLVNFTARKRVLRQAGLVGMGFGMLFFGLALMKTAVGAYHDEIRAWLAAYAAGGLGTRILAFLVAMLATAILQSSAATVVMIQALAFSGALTNLEVAVCLVLGTHVGTCVTALLAAMQASLSARRAAVAHLLFNLMGVVLTLLLFRGYLRVVPLTSTQLGFQVSNVHLLIKLVNALLFLPFTRPFARLVETLTPGDDTLNATPRFLDYGIRARPADPLGGATREIRRLCGICLDMIEDAIGSFFTRDEMKQELVLKRETLVDNLCQTVTQYINDVARGDLPPDCAGRALLLLHILRDVERIGDHAENIVETSQGYTHDESRFSPEAKQEVAQLLAKILELGRAACEQISDPTRQRARDVVSIKRDINADASRCLGNHEGRLRSGACSVVAGIVFVDLLADLRRVANHLRNVAMTATGEIHEHTLQAERLRRDIERDLDDSEG